MTRLIPVDPFAPPHDHKWVNPMSGGSPVFNDPVCSFCGLHPTADDLPFDYPSEPNLGAAKPPPHRHRWVLVDRIPGYPDAFMCQRCGKRQDATASRRGRTNRSRGNSIEREVGKQLGLKRVGQFGGATDLGVSADPFAVSVKSGSGYFSERYWDQLRRQPVAAGQTALLVVTDAPGPGRKRRAIVVLDLADWIALHGLAGVGA